MHVCNYFIIGQLPSTLTLAFSNWVHVCGRNEFLFRGDASREESSLIILLLVLLHSTSKKQDTRLGSQLEGYRSLLSPFLNPDETGNCHQRLVNRVSGT